MGKRKLKHDGIYFTGESSNDVTGSQYYIRFGDSQILLECGLHQSRSNSYLDSYKINSEKFVYKPSELDYVFVAHPHIDHCGLLPRLVKKGFHGKIVTTAETAKIMKSLLLNSCFIVQNEAQILSKKFKREYTPLYDESDVYNTMELVKVYDQYNHIYDLNNTVSFQWLYNSHCVGAAQVEIILHSAEKTKKILYTSDLGSINTSNHYVNKTEIPNDHTDVTIMESTYGSHDRICNKTRNTDVKHLKTAIDTVLSRGGSVIFPCFSFSRTQEVLTTLYDLYHEDKDFNFDIIVDSKLSCEICDLYSSILYNGNLVYWDKVHDWDRVRYIDEKENSKACIADRTPKIVLSSSGFCTNGRIVSWLRKYLSDTNSMIIFTGYAGDNPSYLSYRIKNYRKNRFININKEKIPNKADCISLSTFSSHANHNDLVKFGSSLNTNKLVLVHGSSDSKKDLSKDLEQAISKNNKSYKVISSYKGMSINL